MTVKNKHCIDRATFVLSPAFMLWWLFVGWLKSKRVTIDESLVS